jgi:hypothetical protein
MLIASFTKKEVKAVIFDMKHNKALQSDGFLVECYQCFWEIIKYDMMALFKDFHDGTLPLFHMKYGIIMLVPKQKESTIIKQHRPICLLNVSFFINFTKMAVRRLTKVVEYCLHTWDEHNGRNRNSSQDFTRTAYQKDEWSNPEIRFRKSLQ